MKKIVIVLTLPVFVFISFNATAQFNVVPDAVELAVLKDIYDSLGGASWTAKTNWPTPGNWPATATYSQFGTWFGVQVYQGDIVQISIQNNNVTGNVPYSISDLTKLERLLLNSNHLSGNFPPAILDLQQLRTLTLASNQLSGPLPEEIGNLHNLVILDLSGNSFSGSLPSSLGDITNLQSLWLNNNQFSGPIPSTIGNCHDLRMLYLGNNNFHSELPDMFGQMTHLTDVRLHSAYLTGPLPPSLSASGSTLIRLLLQSNQLTGPIPSTWSTMTTLGEVNMQYNQLSGELPSFIGNWTGTGTFLIDFNKFSGDIPSSFSNCVSMYNIGVSNNRFTGAFPSTASMPSLTRITATNNNFTSLPSSLLTPPLLISIAFDNNDLVSIPDFGTYSNRANLVLKLQNNRLDFSQLEVLVGKNIKTLTQTPQKTINDIPTQSLPVGSSFVLTARPAGAGTSYTWEKLSANGSTWNALSNDQDAVPNTYTRTTATANDAGSYRWKSTSSVITGVTIQSEAIVVKTPQAFTLDNWAFQYKYDGRRRMTHKKVPGADWVYMVYDNRDRLVMTQDGEQRKSNNWMVTKYDALNRPVVTALYTHGSYKSQQGMDSLISKTSFAESFTGTGFSGYTTNVFPTTNLLILTATYYDNYSFVNNADLTYKSDQLTDQYKYNNSNDTSFPLVTGMVTGTKVRVMEAAYYMSTANYYDDKGRVVQTVSENYDGGIDRVSNNYDFVGRITSTRTTHSVSNLHWQNVASMQVVGNTVVGTPGATSGASSVEFIPASTDGWAEATVTETNLWRYWGLADTDPDKLESSIDYCFYLFGTTLQVRESGILRTSVSNLAMGDRLRIARTGTTVKYYRNGTLVYTSGVASSTLLRVDVVLSSNYSTILNLNISNARSTQTTLREFDYDHAGRLLTTHHTVNGGERILMTKNEYNELGQLITKRLHDKGSDHFAQRLDYRYNIRGWLLRMNHSNVVSSVNLSENGSDATDLFGFELAYEGDLGTGNNRLFNGNIAGMKWSVGLSLNPQQRETAYNYGYDAMNRLTSATFKSRIPGSWTNPTNAYSESDYTYDLNGNILGLKRRDETGAEMDHLTYQYGSGETAGNQLLKVSDSGDKTKGFKEEADVYDDYKYDRNGNMTADNNKLVNSILYNLLNLPAYVLKTNGEAMHYYYDATGRKLSQVVRDPSGVQTKSTDYHGEYIYENDTLKFANTEEGRVILTGAEPEYQYHLKDHLGNVRMTFTTKDAADSVKATMEAGDEIIESGNFLRYDLAKRVQSFLFDRTRNGLQDDAGYAVRLNGSENERIGLAKSLSVMPGDTVRAEVFAKYVDPDDNNWENALTTLMGYLSNPSGAPANTIIDGNGYATSGTTPLGISPIGRSGASDGEVPKAYLNYIFINRNFDLSSVRPLAERITTEGKEDGSDGPHARLTIEDVITEAGYVYVYLSNDGEEVREVYFDDFKVEHIKSPVIQSSDYFPFGLTYNNYQRENSLNNRWKFQGQEHIEELGINWDSFKWRNHQPDIGRFFNVDPLSEKYYYNSPYAFSENKVTTHVELEGLESLFFARVPLVGRTAGATSRLARTGGETQEHHLIPRAFRGNRTVESAKREGFKFEGQENKLEVERFSKQTGEGQHGNHPKYNQEVGDRLKNFETENPGASGTEALEFIRNLAKDMKGTIENNPSTKINDLFKQLGIEFQVTNASDATLDRGPSMEQKADAKEVLRTKAAIQNLLEFQDNTLEKAKYRDKRDKEWH